MSEADRAGERDGVERRVNRLQALAEAVHRLRSLLEGTPVAALIIPQMPCAAAISGDRPVRLHLEAEHPERRDDDDEVNLALNLATVFGHVERVQNDPVGRIRISAEPIENDLFAR